MTRLVEQTHHGQRPGPDRRNRVQDADRQQRHGRRCGPVGPVGPRSYRAGTAAGDPYSHHNLGVLLLARGDGGAAIREFGLGAAAGDHLATATLWLIDPHPSR